VPNALILEGLDVMACWGFTYKKLVWHKVRRDGGPDGRDVGFYVRNVTELMLFGVRGSLRTRNPVQPCLIHFPVVELGKHPADRHSTLPAKLAQQRRSMRIHLINPSDVSFGIGVITPRWLYVMAAATPPAYGDPVLTDETLDAVDFSSIQPGDIVGV
jgi:N6-adenosine-specific RNA methylase IME4